MAVVIQADPRNSTTPQPSSANNGGVGTPPSLADDYELKRYGNQELWVPKPQKEANDRLRDIHAGYDAGRSIFYSDPDMQDLRARRMDLAKGYNGQEMGAMREQARSEIQGKRAGYMQQMAARQGRAGIGGARAAAAQASADRGFQQNAAELERKMTLDNANLTRQGTNDLQNFLMRQKYGMLGTGLGYGQLGVADRTQQAAAAANNAGGGGFNLFDPSSWFRD